MISMSQVTNYYSVDKTFNVLPSQPKNESKLNTLQELHCTNFMDESEDSLDAHSVS